MTLLLVLGIIAGLALLTVAADQFVLGAARVATAMKLSPVVIGAVVIGFGTSAPEMVVSSLAAASGSLDIAVGNIIGSNVANLSLVLGVASMVAPITVGASAIRREAPLSLFSVLMFAWLVQDGLSATDGVIFLTLLIASLSYILWRSKKDGAEADPLTAEVDELVDGDGLNRGRESLRTLGGLLGTLAAAQLLVYCSTELAAIAGLNEGFVGVTIIAIGTSLPELATSLQAVRKNETGLIVGNLLGSNLFNSLAVAAAAAFAGPGMVSDTRLLSTGVILMVTVAVATTIMMATGRRIVRWEGGLLLIGYLATLPLLA
jgi:cation:H+ antiporter